MPPHNSSHLPVSEAWRLGLPILYLLFPQDKVPFPLNLSPQLLFCWQVEPVFRGEELAAFVQHGVFHHGMVLLSAEDEADGRVVVRPFCHVQCQGLTLYYSSKRIQDSLTATIAKRRNASTENHKLSFFLPERTRIRVSSTIASPPCRRSNRPDSNSLCTGSLRMDHL